MKIKLFKSILTTLIIVICSCSFKHYDSELLIGKWETQLSLPEAGVWMLTLEYKRNGELYITAHGVLKSGNKKAMFIAKDRSSWRVEGEHYIENTLEQKINILVGDPELKKILNEVLLSNDGKEDRGKILKLTQEVFIVSQEVENKPDYIMILHKIK